MSASLCPVCGQPERLTSPITVMQVHAPGLERPYPLLPAEDYSVCQNTDCESVLRLVARAIDSHPVTRSHAAEWTQVTVVFADPEQSPWRVRERRAPAPPVARA